MKSKTTKAATNSKRRPVIRVAKLTNPTTKREVLERVTTVGRLSTRAAKALGVKRASSWTEVEATSWAAATKTVRAGKGKLVRAGAT